MATALIAEIPASARRRESSLSGARAAAALGFLLGVFLAFLGFAWDVQWHIDVGPDTFFTAPHLVLYGGIAISGLTSLAMVLFTTRQARRGNPAALAGTTAILGGRFQGPPGYVIGGFGALFFLLFGLMDQWWHSLYGFDVTLVSPPHVGLILSIMLTMAGCLTALAWHVRIAEDESRRTVAAIGAVFAAAVLVAFITPTLTDLFPWALFEVVSWHTVVISLLFPAAILMLAAIVRRPRTGTLFGLVFTGLDLLITAVVPVITANYASSIGLFLRDNTSGQVFVSGVVPTYVLAAGVLVDVILFVGARQGWRVGVVVPIAGAAAALALRLLEPVLPIYQPHSSYPPEMLEAIVAVAAAVATSGLILAPVLGALAGWFGWLLGVMLAMAGRGETPAGARGAPALATAAAAAALILAATMPTGALAHPSDPHHETIEAGPYTVTIGFSEWPIRAERSLDITFEPEGGIADKTAVIRIVDPAGDWYEVGPLGRHPRQRELWGLDLIALPAEGDWTIELTVTGLEGTGSGILSGIPVEARPGPPLWPMWLIALLPLAFLVGIGVRGWRAVGPSRVPEAHAWG